MGIELEVTRRPYSFHGGNRTEKQVWQWRKGLSVLCGDKALNQLLEARAITQEQAQLVKSDPRKAFADSGFTGMLTLLAQQFGVPAPPYAKIIELHESGEDLGWARYRKVSAFDHALGESAVSSLSKLGVSGRAKPIHFRFDVDFSWHPVESQRSLIWAAQYGKQEELVDVLARKHFEEATSVNHRATLLDAATEVGLDATALLAYLASGVAEAQVWQSYSDTIEKHGIHAIPFFVFNGLGLSRGGPFRGGGSGGHVVRGSANVDEFVAIFDAILAESLQPKRAIRAAPAAARAQKTAEGPQLGGTAGGMRKGFLLGE